jgi:large subunit ribosomal protein L24
MSKAKCRIRRDDTVLVIAGKNKGTRGRVLRVLPDTGRLVVEGVNRIKRHQKPVGDQPGGIIEREASIHVSNVALWLGDDDGRKVKVGFKTQDDGTKVRVDRKTGEVIESV